MERRTVVRILRAIRREKGWSQRELGARIGVSKSEVSRWEASDARTCSVAELEAWAAALGAFAVVDLRVRGERPLTDARHAALQAWLADRLRADGWIVEPEVSFNVYGDRGRVDLFAVHPSARIVLVVAVKSRLVDVQETLGRLDVKRRVAPSLAADRGWPAVVVVPLLAIVEGSTARRRIASYQALFARFECRARRAMAWLRAPRMPAPTGILLLVRLPGGESGHKVALQPRPAQAKRSASSAGGVSSSWS